MRSAPSRITLNVPIRLISTTLRNASSGNGPSLPRVLIALPVPAQLITMRSGPSASAASSAAVTAASSVTSVCAKRHAIAELGPELVDGLLAPDVQHDHLRARVEQPLRGGQAETRGSPGDDGYGVLDLH